MKTISTIALVALLSSSQAVRFSDDNEGGWVNPLTASDNGVGDDSVVT